MIDKQNNHAEEMAQSAGKESTQQGISSVANKQSFNSNQKALFLIGIVFLLLSVAAVAWFTHSRKTQEPQSSNSEQLTRITSNQTLTLPPLESIMPEQPPEPEVAEDIKQEPPSVADYSIQQPTEPPEPTLSERRFQAPMMGDEKTISKSSSKDHLGLSETLENEGYVSRDGGRLGSMLSSVNTPASKAKSMGDRTLLLPKGTFINCILETKLDTTVPGMTSCVIPNNIYSANGKVLLIERGSKVIGEYKGAVENGLNRIFVLWTQVQTPHGIRVALDSPGADPLGGSGLTGDVDFHWWARFGNALLFSLVQDGFDFAISKANEGGDGVNYYQNSEDGMNSIIQEAMRQSGNIPPTLTKNQGEYIGIFVARDVDFSGVYTLKKTK